MIRTVILSDLHYSPNKEPRAERETAERDCALGDILLLRAVRRINRFLKPDLVIVTGDLCDDPSDTDALRTLADTLNLLEAPKLILPGNHDLPPEAFYRVIPEAPEHLDLGGFRFLPFLDREEEGYHATRSQEDLQRLRKHAGEFPGCIVSVQHVPLFRAGSQPSPYRILNAEEILAERVNLSIAGHWHPGFAEEESDKAGNGFTSICAPALCESPYAYLVAELHEDGRSVIRREQLRLDESYEYIDTHVHTRNAYCQENMDPERTLAFIRAFGLSAFAFTEHSGQLYVSSGDYWSGNAQRNGIANTERLDRTSDYFELLDELERKNNGPKFLRGFELDVDARGELMVETRDLAKVRLRLGALHWVSADASNQEAFQRDFLFRCEALLKQGIHILAHPFRIYRRHALSAPESLYDPLAAMLKRYGCAAEINFHTNEPDDLFFRRCMEHGVKITLGSDSHNLYEIGEFYAHTALLKRIGAGQEHLWSPDLLEKTRKRGGIQ